MEKTVKKPKLNKNAQKLVKALRSGKYRQCKGALCKKDSKGEKYCCLGVAMEVYRKEHPELEKEFQYNEAFYGEDLEISKEGDFVYIDNGESSELTREVADWLGFNTKNGSYSRNGKTHSLIGLNDDGKKSFEYIADVMEEMPTGLFVDN